MNGARNHTGHRLGEWHGRAKYSDDLVRAIRAEYQRGKYGKGCRALGRKFNLPWRTVADIVSHATRINV